MGAPARRSLALALALLLLAGPLGAHRFYLGRWRSGLGLLALTLVTGAALVLYVAAPFAAALALWLLADLVSIRRLVGRSGAA